MKLYLSSYGVGNQPEKLQELVGGNKLAAVIVNAQDYKTPEERQERVIRGQHEMTELGFQAEELDLRNYFDTPGQLKSHLRQFGLVWIWGGNTFILRRAMRRSGFDVCIRPLMDSEDMVYAGFSAGSCTASPDLHGIEFVDDPDEVPSGYDSPIIWKGLNFIPYSIAPHYRSEHPASEAVEKTVAYFEQYNIPYRTLRDGQAIVIHGDQEAITG